MSNTAVMPSVTHNGVTLPLIPTPAETLSPDFMIIYSPPKVGKSTLVGLLPNCLILDCENGTRSVSGLKYKINNIQELWAVGQAIQTAGYPYQAIAIDTASALEELVLPYAEQLYAGTSMGKNWYTTGKAKYGSLINLPDGAAYQYLREAFITAMDFVRSLAPRTILLAHVKDIYLGQADGEVRTMDVNLTGKLRTIMTSKADAVGYLKRKGNQNILSFKTSEEIACGARSPHLRNADVVISELIKHEDGREELRAFWQNVYID